MESPIERSHKRIRKITAEKNQDEHKDLHSPR